MTKREARRAERARLMKELEGLTKKLEPFKVSLLGAVRGHDPIPMDPFERDRLMATMSVSDWGFVSNLIALQSKQQMRQLGSLGLEGLESAVPVLLSASKQFEEYLATMRHGETVPRAEQYAS